MSRPDADELTDEILRRLAAGVAEGDIVTAVCRRTVLSWPEAEALVESVCLGRSEEVARRQLPILVPLTELSMAGGFVLLRAAAYPLLAPLLETSTGRG